MATITSKIVKEIINFPKMTGTRIVCKQLPNTCAKHLIVQNSKLHANRKQKKRRLINSTKRDFTYLNREKLFCLVVMYLLASLLLKNIITCASTVFNPKNTLTVNVLFIQLTVTYTN